MAKDGIFARSKGLLTTTLMETETTLHHTLRTVSNGAKMLQTIAQESLIDSQADLVDTKVSYAVKHSEATERLKALGYSAEQTAEYLSNDL